MFDSIPYPAITQRPELALVAFDSIDDCHAHCELFYDSGFSECFEEARQMRGHAEQRCYFDTLNGDLDSIHCDVANDTDDQLRD